jgi:hypothetical protein
VNNMNNVNKSDTCLYVCLAGQADGLVELDRVDSAEGDVDVVQIAVAVDVLASLCV